MDDFQDLILSELKDLKNEVKEVRQTDIPSIREDMASFTGSYKTKLKAIEKSQKWYSGIYTLVGGALAVLISKYTGVSH